MTPSAHPRRDFLKFASFAGSGAALASMGHAANAAVPPELAQRGMHWANVLDHGAVSDGRTKNTVALQRLIDRLGAAGGGTVYFPPGRYLTGALHLRSCLTLHLEAGATLQFSEDFADYLPMVPSRWQGLGVNNFSPLLYAHRAHDIAITGRGTIDGAGAVWWDYVLKVRREAKEKGKPPTSRWQELFLAANPPVPGEKQRAESFGFLRPSLFQAIECENVLLAGVTLRNSPFWTTHFVTCDNVVADGLSIYAPDSPNTDGINPESSRNVRIANCKIHADDDCITIKAGKNKWGRENAKPCENITVTNCVMTSGAAGVGIGSEMSAGVRRVVVSNCVFDGTHAGVHIKANRGRGGIMEDISVSNIVMNRITPGPAVWLNLEYWIQTQPEPFNEGTPRIRGIDISHVRGTDLRKSVEIVGLQESPIREVRLSHLNLVSEEGILVKHADDLRLEDVRIAARRGLPFSCEKTTRLELRGVRSDGGDETAPRIKLEDVRQCVIGGCGLFSSGRPLLSVHGAGSGDIRVLGDNAPSAASPVKVAPEVPAGAVSQPAG